MIHQEARTIRDNGTRGATVDRLRCARKGLEKKRVVRETGRIWRVYKDHNPTLRIKITPPEPKARRRKRSAGGILLPKSKPSVFLEAFVRIAPPGNGGINLQKLHQ